jgi:hypothetical protein
MVPLGMVQVARLVSRGYLPVRPQPVFHLLEGQEWNKHFDACPLLKLVRFGAQHPVNGGDWKRDLFSEILHDALPLRWLALERVLSQTANSLKITGVLLLLPTRKHR